MRAEKFHSDGTNVGEFHAELCVTVTGHSAENTAHACIPNPFICWDLMLCRSSRQLNESVLYTTPIKSIHRLTFNFAPSTGVKSTGDTAAGVTAHESGLPAHSVRETAHAAGLPGHSVRGTASESGLHAHGVQATAHESGLPGHTVRETSPGLPAHSVRDTAHATGLPVHAARDTAHQSSGFPVHATKGTAHDVRAPTVQAPAVRASHTTEIVPFAPHRSLTVSIAGHVLPPGHYRVSLDLQSIAGAPKHAWKSVAIGPGKPFQFSLHAAAVNERARHISKPAIHFFVEELLPREQKASEAKQEHSAKKMRLNNSGGKGQRCEYKLGKNPFQVHTSTKGKRKKETQTKGLFSYEIEIRINGKAQKPNCH